MSYILEAGREGLRPDSLLQADNLCGTCDTPRPTTTGRWVTNRTVRGMSLRQELEHLGNLSTGNRSLFAKRRTVVFALVPLGLLLLIVLIGLNNLLLGMKPDLVVIELERRGCYGVCPIYSLQILGDGRVRYEGQRFVRVQGVQSAQLNPGQVQEIVTAFKNINFFAMPDQLSYGIEDLEETRT